MHKLVIRNCRAPTWNGLVDIGISDGLISEIGLGLRGDVVIDAGGNLVLASFVILHLHLCKVYSFEIVGAEAVTFYRSGGMPRKSAISLSEI